LKAQVQELTLKLSRVDSDWQQRTNEIQRRSKQAEQQRNAQQQAEALELLDQHELAALAPVVAVPEPIEKRVKEVLIEEEVIHQNLRMKVQKKVEVEDEAEEISEFEQAFMNAVAMKRKI